MGRTSWLVVGFLGIWVARVAVADGPASVGAGAATPQRVERAVERGAGYLRGESAAWLKQRTCAACHHAAMPLWALGEAGRRGYAVDRKFVAETMEATLGSAEKMIASKIVPDPKAPPDPRPMGRGVSMGAVFMAAVAGTFPSLEGGQKQSLRMVADDIVKKQRGDGSWEFFLSRPPINESQATDAAWIVMALQADVAAGGAGESHRAALEKGMAWLAGAEPENRQAKVLKLLVALRARKGREALKADLDELVAWQRGDGGWGQTAGAASDALATGQALYVLSLAGYTAGRAEVGRGVDYLVSTQKGDGSWPMASRATPDGRPGSAKLLTPITCGGSSWAVLGLVGVAPKGAEGGGR